MKKQTNDLQLQWKTNKQTNVKILETNEQVMRKSEITKENRYARTMNGRKTVQKSE